MATKYLVSTDCVFTEPLTIFDTLDDAKVGELKISVKRRIRCPK